MGWWYRITALALAVGVGTAGVSQGMIQKGNMRGKAVEARKEKEVRGTPRVQYKNGVVPNRGGRLMGFTPTMIVDTFAPGVGIDPTIWDTVINENGDTVAWDTATSVPGSGAFPNPPGAVYDDDAAGSSAPPGVEALISNPIDFTMFSSGDTVYLRFYSDFEIYGAGGGEYAAVAIQPFAFGGWGSWDTVWTVTGTDLAGYEIVDLSTYAVSDSIKLAFVFTDTSGVWGWGWGIDDIALGTFTSQVFLSENFEGCALPAGWTTQDDNADGFTWTVVDTTADNDIGSFAPPNPGQCYAYYSDDDAGTGAPPGDEWLISPAIGVAGFNNVGLAFDMGFRVIDVANEAFVVYARTHDGTSWGSWTEVYNYMGDDISQSVEVDLSSLMPAESLQLAFVYRDMNGGWYWAIGVDNIMVYEIVPPSTDVGVVSLVPGEFGVAPPSFSPQVTVKNFGLSTQSFQVHLKIEDTQANVLYQDSLPVNYLQSGNLSTNTFSTFNATVGDTLILTAWTDLADDNPSNDQTQYTVVVRHALDASVAVSGPAYGDPLFSYTFTVDISNVGADSLDTVQVEVAFIDQATGTAAQADTLTATGIQPTATASLTTAFQPPDPLTDYTVQAAVLTADDNAANDTATTTFSTQIAPMGTVLASYTFPTTLPAGYDLAGITYREDNGKFYVVSMNTPGVYELDPTTGTLTFLFNTYAFGANDIPWGIAFDPTDTTLWVTQIDAATSVGYLYAAKYDFSGTLLDTVDLMALTGQGYIAGMDYFPRTQEPGGQTVGGYFWAVGVADPSWNTMATIWKLDLHTKTVVGQVANPDPQTYRGVAYYAHGVNLVFLGGWNQDQVHIWDSTLTSQFAAFDAPSVADLDLWEDLTHYQALAVLNIQHTDNIIQVVALGMPWQVSVEEGAPREVLRFAPKAMARGRAVALLNLPTAADVKAAVFDATGRRMAQVVDGRLEAGSHRLEWKAPKPGLYFWKVDVGGKVFTAKTVVVR